MSLLCFVFNKYGEIRVDSNSSICKKTSLSSKDDSSGHWQPVATTGVYFKNNFICRHPWFQLYSTTIKRRRLGMHGRLAALIACVRLWSISRPRDAHKFPSAQRGAVQSPATTSARRRRVDFMDFYHAESVFCWCTSALLLAGGRGRCYIAGVAVWWIIEERSPAGSYRIACILLFITSFTDVRRIARYVLMLLYRSARGLAHQFEGRGRGCGEAEHQPQQRAVSPCSCWMRDHHHRHRHHHSDRLMILCYSLLNGRICLHGVLDHLVGFRTHFKSRHFHFISSL